jgi:sugar O-acyltransferase (sialic acid O-acetyltransferase NeuD family)
MATSCEKGIKKGTGSIFMKKKLLIIGAGDVGGFIAHNPDLFTQRFERLGVLDDDQAKWGKRLGGWEVLGPISNVVKFIDDDLIIAIGVAEPSIKKEILAFLSKYDLKYPPLIATNAWISQGVKIGQGVIIYPGVSINHGSIINDFVLINMNCALGHDTIVGSTSFLSPGVSTGGFTKLGSGVKMGINSATRQQVKVGDGATVAGHGMVIRDVEPNTTVAGVPAQQLNL